MSCKCPNTGIQKFYQVGEHKSYVKIHYFMENLIPVSSTGITGERDAGMTGRGATSMTPFAVRITLAKQMFVQL
ncbi:MAG: hypothetical protein LBJ80_04045 [Rickettsiales bacterium]|jgi:hypothetical protein|nr:hypothetical protein [Rickettsiales bacterium]MDR1261561.1 hypothetical protein [Rickettsiales bacterium]